MTIDKISKRPMKSTTLVQQKFLPQAIAEGRIKK
jgi:hypothetical protein